MQVECKSENKIKNSKQDKEGITLIVLVIIVIVLGLFAGIVGYNGLEDINETKLRKFANELKSLEVLTKEYKIRNNGTLGFTAKTLDKSTFDSEMLFQFSEEEDTDGIITLYEIDLEKIDATQTMFGTRSDGEKDIYLVSQTTGNVYYLMGYTINETTYYTLTDDLKDLM